MFRLKGKRVAVIGCDGLLGKVAVETVEELGGKVTEYDLRIGDDIRESSFVVAAMHDNVDAVINCAIGNQAPVKDADLWFKRDLDIGLTGALNVAMGFEQALRRNKGSLVFVGSDLSFIAPYPERYAPNYKPLAYSVVKHGIIGMTRYLAAHWGPDVRVNCLCPGGIDQGQAVPRCPLGRLAKPEEMKGPIAFLLSEASSYMTGTTLVVDGGRTIW
jgi:NAD(P)-dependent dehydrogenase (short-subunit alcohol dehydrogenase family)